MFSKFHLRPLLLLLLSLLLVGLFACGNHSSGQKNPADAKSPGQNDSKLTFYNVTLNQFDEVGRPTWSVKAKQAIYSKENKIAQAESPYGELYQDGKAVYHVTAERANIEQDGKILFLKGKIIATDPANGIILHGNELEWRPKEDLLIVRNQFNGTHKQLQAVAEQAQVKTRQQRMEFIGKVVAISTEPQLQMQTEDLIWQIKQQELIANRPIQIDRYENNQITARGRGDTAQVNLKTKIATVTKNGQIELQAPPVQIVSNSMSWDLNAETVNTNAPVRVYQRTDNVTVTANRGEMKIAQKIVYLTGNVYGIGNRQQSLKSKKLTWYLNNQLVEANGDVVYQQIDPPLNFTGQQATGNLQTEDIVVKNGNSGGKVVTEIIPNIKGNGE